MQKNTALKQVPVRSATPLKVVKPTGKKRPKPNTRPILKAANAVFGAYMGGMIPIFGFGSAHALHRYYNDLNGYQVALALIFIVAAMIWSAPKVFDWSVKTFGDKDKFTGIQTGKGAAFGFVVLLEGSMIAAETLHQAWMSYTALATLVFINAWCGAARRLQAYK